MNIYKRKAYISYNQIIIYDDIVKDPGCAWTDAHVRQGFARRDETVSFYSFIEHGDATVTVYNEKPANLDIYSRVISTGITLLTGKLRIEGPEEDLDENALIFLEIGYYAVWCCQSITNEAEQLFDFYLDKCEHRVLSSKVVKADSFLSPDPVLVEIAEPA